MRNQRIVFRYFVFSLGFGVVMGLAFPVYARVFVTFRSPVHEIVFTVGCIAAGVLVGLFGFFIGKVTILGVVDRIGIRFDELCEHEGDLTKDIGLNSDDGLGRLASGFDKFQDKLRAIVRQMIDVTDRAQQVGFSLAANVTETSSASSQIAAHMAQIDEQTDTLVSEVQNVDGATIGINESSERVFTNIDRQSESLARLSGILEESMNGIKEISLASDRNARAIVGNIERSNANLEEMARVAQKVGEIDESVARIGELVAAIEDTTERINVLGINASIEASRVGEAGRGFRVVANEIRNLADQSRGNSARIGDTIALVTRQVREGVGLSIDARDGLKSRLCEIRESADDIGAVTEKLRRFAAGADEMILAHADLIRVSVELTNSMVAMKQDTASIEKSIDALMSTAERNRLAIAEISAGMREIAEDVGEMNRASSMNAENIRALGTIAAKFRID